MKWDDLLGTLPAALRDESLRVKELATALLLLVRTISTSDDPHFMAKTTAKWLTELRWEDYQLKS